MVLHVHTQDSLASKAKEAVVFPNPQYFICQVVMNVFAVFFVF